jgi:hypothetical protein
MGTGWIAWGAAGFPEIWGARYEILLTAAKKLRDEGYNEAAIATAQTACETYTELVLSAALRAAVPEHVANTLENLMPTPYNLDNDRVRNVYVAFSGDRIQAEKPLWHRFKQHAKRRKEIVHRGDEATTEEATDSIEVVEKLIRHMMRNARPIHPTS